MKRPGSLSRTLLAMGSLCLVVMFATGCAASLSSIAPTKRSLPPATETISEVRPSIEPAGDLAQSGVSPVPSKMLPKADPWGVLPGEVPHSGSGKFTVVKGTTQAPQPDRRVRTLQIRVEKGLPIDSQAFATAVMDTLNDERGWGDIDNVSFARTDKKTDADFVLTLASATTTNDLCVGIDTADYTSCGQTSAVNLNVERWIFGADPFLDAGGSLADYRRYVVNHEVGHFLLHPHVDCPSQGSLAPVMLQQTLRMQGCEPNGWPNP